jgi:hypothetical protein
MKNTLLLSASLLFIALACNNNNNNNGHEDNADHKDHKDTIAMAEPAKAEETKEEAAPDSAAMMKAWMDYATPGEMHKWMATADGKWEGEQRSCMGPGKPLGPPNKITATNKMILNGLYQESVYKGNMGGMDFEGHGIMAYDKARKKFVNTWIDNMGSGVLVMEGDYDEGSKSMKLSGKATDPLTKKELEYREVLTMVSDKEQLMEMYSDHNGEEYKMMEIRMKKK